MADRMADEGSKMDSSLCPVSHSAVKGLAKKCVKDRWLENVRKDYLHYIVMGDHATLKPDETLNTFEQGIMAQLRCNCSPLTRDTLFQYGKIASSLCPACKEK